MNNYQHAYLLDGLCRMRPADSQDYTVNHIKIYSHVNQTGCFQALQDTPHFQGLIRSVALPCQPTAGPASRVPCRRWPHDQDAAPPTPTVLTPTVLTVPARRLDPAVCRRALTSIVWCGVFCRYLVATANITKVVEALLSGKRLSAEEPMLHEAADLVRCLIDTNPGAKLSTVLVKSLKKNQKNKHDSYAKVSTPQH